MISHVISQRTLFGESPRLVHRPAMAAPEGSGPAGETCGTCRHCTRVGHHDYTYFKCGLMQAYWTHGAGSDIRKKWAACREFEPKQGSE